MAICWQQKGAVLATKSFIQAMMFNSFFKELRKTTTKLISKEHTTNLIAHAKRKKEA